MDEIDKKVKRLIELLVICALQKNVDIHNSMQASIEDMISEVIQGGEEARKLVYNELDHSSPYVRLECAGLLIQTDPDKAKEVLSEIADGHYWPYSIEAEIGLSEWEAGRANWPSFPRNL